MKRGEGGRYAQEFSDFFCARSSMRYPLVISLSIFSLVLNREESGGVGRHKKDVYIQGVF